jgi:hypothetical protein
MDTSQGTYEMFKEEYKTPARQFSNIKIKGNVLKLGFQVSTAPCLGNKNLKRSFCTRKIEEIHQQHARRLARRLSKPSSQR